MNVSGLAPNSLLALSSLLKSGGSSAADAFAPAQGSANSAGGAPAAKSILPPGGAMQLSLDALLALQAEEEQQPTAIKEMSAEDKFLEEARKSPMQRMREQVLDELGLSEDALAQMSPEERRSAEDKIREMIEEKLRQAMNADAAPPESNAAMLQTLL
jgi:hypothetical protein